MQQVSQNIPVDFIDTDQNSVLTVKYNIRSVPTVVLVNSGTELKRFTGVRNKQEVINFYNN
jgi:thioredoxin-like negative regulator of GroEL